MHEGKREQVKEYRKGCGRRWGALAGIYMREYGHKCHFRANKWPPNRSPASRTKHACHIESACRPISVQCCGIAPIESVASQFILSFMQIRDMCIDCSIRSADLMCIYTPELCRLQLERRVVKSSQARIHSGSQ